MCHINANPLFAFHKLYKHLCSSHLQNYLLLHALGILMRGEKGLRMRHSERLMNPKIERTYNCTCKPCSWPAPLPPLLRPSSLSLSLPPSDPALTLSPSPSASLPPSTWPGPPRPAVALSVNLYSLQLPGNETCGTPGDRQRMSCRGVDFTKRLCALAPPPPPPPATCRPPHPWGGALLSAGDRCSQRHSQQPAAQP